MKSVGDIAQKLKQVQFRHSKKEIEKLLSRTPSNCVFQKRVEVKGSGGLGFCTCPEIGLKACDVSAEHLNRAPDCPRFSLKMSVEEAKESVKSFFRDSPPAEIASKYPDAAALMWVLDDEVSNPPDVYLVPNLGSLPLWASSPERAAEASAQIEALQEAQVELHKKKLELTNALMDLENKSNRIAELNLRTNIQECSLAAVNSERDRMLRERKPPGFFKSLLISVVFFVGSLFRK